MTSEGPSTCDMRPDECRTAKDDAEVAQFLSFLNAECTLQHESKKSDFKQFYQTVEGNPIVMVKGECTIDASLREVVEFLSPQSDEAFRTTMKTCDTMFTGGRIVEFQDAKHRILYATFKMPKPISDRDIVWREFNSMLDESTAVVMGQSVQHPDHPEGKGMMDYVRAEITTSGYHLKALDDGKCFVSYLVQVNPKGWLPPMVVNYVAADQAANVKRLRDHFAAPRK